MNYRRPMRICSKRCTPLVVDVCVGQVLSCLRQQAVNWDFPATSIYQITAIKFTALSGLVRTRLDSAIRVSLLHFQTKQCRLGWLRSRLVRMQSAACSCCSIIVGCLPCAVRLVGRIRWEGSLEALISRFRDEIRNDLDAITNRRDGIGSGVSHVMSEYECEV